MTFSELSVTIKDEEKRLKKDFSSYKVYQVHANDPFIKKCIDETLDNFNAEPIDVTVNIKMVVQ